MANPQKENGYTAIANEVLEHLARYEFPKNTSGCPMAICLCVIRKTWGFQKKIDRISLTQFEQFTNYPRPTVVHWLDYLVKAKLLIVNKDSKQGSIYGFNKDFDQWLPLVKATELVKARKFTSKMALTATSKMALTHKRKKEITKEISNKMQTYTPIDESGNPLKRKSKTKINQVENRELIEVANLWQTLCSKSLQIPKEDVIMQRIYFPIRSTYDREHFTKDQFKELFEYFFKDRDIKQESKLSFDLCLSQKYVGKWKLKNKQKVVTNVSLADGVKL